VEGGDLGGGLALPPPELLHLPPQRREDLGGRVGRWGARARPPADGRDVLGLGDPSIDTKLISC